MHIIEVYEAAPPRKAFSFAWTEANGQRGSSEIGTALLKWFETLPADVKETSLFSDTCSGQNRNQYIAALCMYVVQNTDLNKIEHKFFEKGHSHMEADSMHSAIESAKRYVKVNCMQDWLTIFRIARLKCIKNKTGNAYKVQTLKFDDFVKL